MLSRVFMDPYQYQEVTNTVPSFVRTQLSRAFGSQLKQNTLNENLRV